MLKNNNIFKKNKDFFLPFICTFCLILSLSIFVSFSSNTEVQEVIVKSMTPVYDENSTVVITEDNGVIFNDKDQVVKYNVVLENTQNYDVKINDIKLSTPSEEFLKYEVEGIDKDDVIKANETKELVVSFKTVKMEGWGRNFSDELTANITFDKLKKNEEPVTPEEDKTTTENNTNNGTGNTEPDKKEETPNVESKPSDKEEKPQTNIDKNEPVIKEETTIVPDTNDTEKDTNTESESINTEHELKPAPETKEETTDTSKNTKTILIIVGVVAGVTGITIVILNKNKFAKYTVFIIILGSTLTITNAEDVIGLPITLNVSYKSQNLMMALVDENGEPFEELVNIFPLIKNFYIENELNEITDYVHKFDVTEEQNGRVTAYLVESEDASVCTNLQEDEKPCLDMYLQSDGIIYPNTNASWYFGFMINLESINNLEGFDTSNVTNMTYMFAYAGAYNQDFHLDLSHFNTSNVTNMTYMFAYAGFSSTNVTLDLSNMDASSVRDMSGMFFNTGGYGKNISIDLSNMDASSVTDMSEMFDGTGANSESLLIDFTDIDTSNITNTNQMFYQTGRNSTNFTLDVSDLDTSNVKDMSEMFRSTGAGNPTFTLDLSNFDTRNVTDMSKMFESTGYNSTNFTLDVSSFDTRNVTDMSRMFWHTGYNSTNFTLDLSNFDTSNVTCMNEMFSSTGYNSTNFTLDLSNFDTSNVKYMSGMFRSTGYNSTNFTLDVSNFDTSNVTNMNEMFMLTGYKSTVFTLDVSNFDTSSCTDMSYMFYQAGYSNPNFTLDVSNFDTSKVTDMSFMFKETGYNSTVFTLDVSNFDTSNVTNMRDMFNYTGYRSTKLNTSITIRNPSVTDYTSMFYNAALLSGCKIIVNYTSETGNLVDKMIATKWTSNNVIKGKLIVDVDNLSIGDEIHIENEKFNVISQTDDTITMLAQYKLDTDYKQSTTAPGVAFSDTAGWEYTPGPKEIDIQTWSTNPKTYVNEYVTYLRGVTGDTTLSGDLITLSELKELGCTIYDDYSITEENYKNITCANSQYADWINLDNWWTRSAAPEYEWGVYRMNSNGTLRLDGYNSAANGIRPTITVSKEALKNYMKN